MSEIIFNDHSSVAILKSGAMVVTSQSAGDDFSQTTKQFTNTIPGTDDVMGNIAMWGKNNLLPLEMALDIESTGVLTAAIQAKARIAIGKGPMPCKIVGVNKDGYEELEFIQDPEIETWMEENDALGNANDTLYDLFGFGNAWQQLVFNGKRDYLIGHKRVDACECRFEALSPVNRKINNVYLSGDWKQYNNSNAPITDAHYDRIALLDRKFPLWDLRSRKSGTNFMISLQATLSGRKYYARAPWQSAKRWVNISQAVPEMKESLFKNQITIKYLVEIHEAFWPDYNNKWSELDSAQKKAVVEQFYKELDTYLTGGKNAYKSLMFRTVFDRVANQFVPAIKITAIDDKIKDGKHIIDSAAANIEILLPMQMNASLLGVSFPGSGMGGGAGSGSDIRESYLVQIMLLEVERRQNCTVYNIAKSVNGWEKRLGHKIYWRYPNQMLTTLNTGKNTQPTA